MGCISDQWYEIERVMSKIEHKKPITVGFIILQYANLSMLQLHYNPFDRCCDVAKIGELEMDTTNSL